MDECVIVCTWVVTSTWKWFNQVIKHFKTGWFRVWKPSLRFRLTLKDLDFYLGQNSLYGLINSVLVEWNNILHKWHDHMAWFTLHILHLCPPYDKCPKTIIWVARIVSCAQPKSNPNEYKWICAFYLAIWQLFELLATCRFP